MGYYADEKALEVAVRDLFRWYEENIDRDFPTNTIRAYLNFTLNSIDGITRQQAIEKIQKACLHFLDEKGFSVIREHIDKID